MTMTNCQNQMDEVLSTAGSLRPPPEYIWPQYGGPLVGKEMGRGCDETEAGTRRAGAGVPAGTTTG